MKKTNLTDLAVNAEAAAFAALMDGGYIDLHGGSMPATADTPLDGQPLAVSMSLGSPAFTRPTMGMLTANPISPSVAVGSVNPVTWARVYRADHKTAVMDVTVGTRDSNIILPSVNIPANITVTCSTFVHAISKSFTER